MELKDVILSTLAELGEEPVPESNSKSEPAEPAAAAKEEAQTAQTPAAAPSPGAPDEEFLQEEREFLERLRERLLVLFEGFQSPNNKRLEAKIDLTLNFLEYLLATLDERIERLKKP